jgi:hypothetical protein
MCLASPPWNTLRKIASSHTPASGEMTASCQIAHGSKMVRTRASRNSPIRSSAGSEECSSQKKRASSGRLARIRARNHAGTIADCQTAAARAKRPASPPQKGAITLQRIRTETSSFARRKVQRFPAPFKAAWARSVCHYQREGGAETHSALGKISWTAAGDRGCSKRRPCDYDKDRARSWGICS